MIPGLAILGILALLVAASLGGLILAAPGAGALHADLAYLAAIAGFTVLQAGLSTLLSLLAGALLALALARRRFPLRGAFLSLLGVATALPAIVLVFALTAVFGRAGLVNDGLAALGLPRVSIYGLTGILLAHVFFNAAFAARVYLAAVEAVPGEHWRLAAMLGMPAGAVLRLIDLPILRRETPALGLLVFIACATSFAIPLALGGGPGSATFEVAIYEALRFDVDFGRAALLAVLQIGAMALIVAAAAPLLVRPPETGAAGRPIERPDRGVPALRLVDGLILLAAAGLILPPLAAIAWSGRAVLGTAGAQTALALATSLAVALPAALLALAAAMALARARAALAEAGARRLAALVTVAPLLIIAVPPLAFAAGLYLIARGVGDPAAIALPTMVLVNAMMALPFVHRLVEPPLALAAERYGRLAASLGMGGLARLRLIEWPLAATSAGAAFAYAAALSLGDLGVVTLFGSDALVTLPALLYEKLGAYRIADAEGVAALLACLVLVLFLLADWLGRRAHAPRP
ncbi:ABC transporter permease subunit [Labrys wisconsinensis]|uniref:Thiamine transport system permease protein n=1 Tax=Labrys wisconsinensis TaxID=425677 RepID=A0ABU0J9C7_9HYPH|nr:ABC transporter permease subunit [Labrys wisconsinensis]MDQ0470869.1 thiamine transport system permease protein [Labrys wisconsinensis]